MTTPHTPEEAEEVAKQLEDAIKELDEVEKLAREVFGIPDGVDVPLWNLQAAGTKSAE